MGFNEAYARKDLLRRQVEESAFNDLVRKLVIQKSITKQEAIGIASERLQERRRNALKLEDYIGGIQQAEEEKRLAGIRRADTLKAKAERERIEAQGRERIRNSIWEVKKRTLETQYTQDLIRMSLMGAPRQADVVGTELSAFEGRVNRFLETLQYGILNAQKLTGKPRFMLIAERNGLLGKLSIWFNQKQGFMNPGQIRVYRNLVNRLSSQEV